MGNYFDLNTICNRILPKVAQHYERLVYDLRALLNTPDCKQEAVTALRKLIDRIDLVPSEGGLLIDIVGNLAAILQLTTPNMQKAVSGEAAFAISLVAGARIKPTGTDAGHPKPPQALTASIGSGRVNAPPHRPKTPTRQV